MSCAFPVRTSACTIDGTQLLLIRCATVQLCGLNEGSGMRREIGSGAWLLARWESPGKHS